MGERDGHREKSQRGASGASGARPRLPKGGKIALGTLLSGAATGLAIVHRASFLETQVLLDLSHVLVLLLAIGWLGRAVIHGCVGYFGLTEAEGVNPYALLGISCLNALFSIAWLAIAIYLLLNGCGALVTAAAVTVACVLCFLLSLSTHWAAAKAKRPRASEWVRKRVRDPLEPGGSTPVGWFLIKLIDWRSAPHYLSTFVGGTLGTLLVILLLTASAAISERAVSEKKKTADIAAKQEKQAKILGVHPTTNPKTTNSALEPTPPPPSLVGLQPQHLNQGTQLLCFTLPSANPKQVPSKLFFCFVMSGGRPTNEAVLLTPSAEP